MFSSEIARMRKLGVQGVSSRVLDVPLYILLLIIFIYYFLTLLFSLSLCVYVCTAFRSLVSCHELAFTIISVNGPTLRDIPNLLLWNNHTMHRWRKIDAFPNT